MTREAMIAFMEENPNVKITHTLFGSEEYIYQKENGIVVSARVVLIVF